MMVLTDLIEEPVSALKTDPVLVAANPFAREMRTGGTGAGAIASEDMTGNGNMVDGDGIRADASRNVKGRETEMLEFWTKTVGELALMKG